MSIEDKEPLQLPFLKTTLTSTFQTKNDLCQKILERNFIRSSCVDYDGMRTTLECEDDYEGSMKSKGESNDYSMKQIEGEKEGRSHHLERGHQFGQHCYGNISKIHDVRDEEINVSPLRSSGEHEVIEEILSADQNISLNEMPPPEGEKEERKESTSGIDGKNIDLSEMKVNGDRYGSSTVIGLYLNSSESKLFGELKVDQGDLSANVTLKPFDLESGHQFKQHSHGKVSYNHDESDENINESYSRSSGEHEIIEEILSADQNISLNEMPPLEGEKEEMKESTSPIGGKNIDRSEMNVNGGRNESNSVIGSYLNSIESELFGELKDDQGGLSANLTLKPFDLESGEPLGQHDHENISNNHGVSDEDIDESNSISSGQHEIFEEILSADQNIFVNENPPINVDTREDSEYDGFLVPDKTTSTFRVASVRSEEVYSEDVDFTQSNKDHEFIPLEDFIDQDLDSLGDSISITFDPVNEVEEVIYDQRYPIERANPSLNHCKTEIPDSDENEVDLITRDNIEEKLGHEKDFEEERGVEISECVDEETLSNMVLNTFSTNPLEQNHTNKEKDLEKSFIDQKFLDKGPINPGKEEGKDDNDDIEEVVKLKEFLSKEEKDLRNLTNHTDNSLHEKSFSPLETNERQLDPSTNEVKLQQVSGEEMTEEFFNEYHSRSPSERQDVGEIMSTDKNSFNHETPSFNLGRYHIVDPKLTTLDQAERDSEHGGANPYKNQREIKTDYNCNDSRDNTENDESEKESSSGEYDLKETNFDQHFASERTNYSFDEDFQKKNEGKEQSLNLRDSNERRYNETSISEEINDNENSPLSDPFTPEEIDNIVQKRILENEEEVNLLASLHPDLSRESNDEEVVFEQRNFPSFLGKVAPVKDEDSADVVAEKGSKESEDEEDHILVTWKNKELQVVSIDEAQDMQENYFPEKIPSREMTQRPLELKNVKEGQYDSENRKETIRKKEDNYVGNNNSSMEDILLDRKETSSDYRKGPRRVDSAINGEMEFYPTVSGGVIQTSSMAFKRDHLKSNDKRHEEPNGKSDYKELKDAKTSNIYDRYKKKVDFKTQEPYQTSNSQDDPVRYVRGGKDPRLPDSQYALPNKSLKESENITREPLQKLNNISSVNDDSYKCNSFEYRSQRQPQNLGPIPGILDLTYRREKYLQEVSHIPCPTGILTSGLIWQTPLCQFSRGSSFGNGIVINPLNNKSEEKFPLCENCYKHHSPINDNVSSFQGVTFPEASSVTNHRRQLNYDRIIPERQTEKPILKEAYLNTNRSSHNFDVRPKYRPLFTKSVSNEYSKVGRDRIKNDPISDQFYQSRPERADDTDNTSLRMRVYCRGKLIHDPEDSR